MFNPVHPKFSTTNLYLHIEIHEANLDQNQIKLDFGTPTYQQLALTDGIAD